MKNESVYIIIGIIATAIGVYLTREQIKTGAEIIMKKLTRNEFVEKYAPIAKIASKGTGLFPSVFMAQAILESGNGNSSLATKGNNFFGIKADKSWTGPIVTMKTREVINGKEVYVDAPFRAYKNPTDSFLDRVNFLTSMSRYRNAGVFIAPTPEAQAKALQKAGYATDPVYADLLIKLINQNDLKKYDT